MNTTIITIGNSKGVRIPQPLLKESKLGREVNITAKAGEIRITAAIPTVTPVPARKTADTALLSQKVLSRDWLRVEEDEAWAGLQ